MPESEAVWMQRQFIVAQTETDDDLRARWQTLAAEVAKLPAVQPDADPQPLSGEAMVVATEITAGEVFQQLFGAGPHDFRSVRIDGLLTAQTNVDVGFGDELDAQLARAASEAEVLRFCMRANPIEAPLVGADGLVTFSSHYAQNLSATQMRIEEVSPTEVRIYASIISRPNYVQVVQFAGRYVLANGYHRAVALKRAGHDRMPCMVRPPVPTLLALQFQPPHFFSDHQMQQPRPPMVVDFLNDELTVPLDARGKSHIMRAGLQIQAFEAPR